MNPVLPHPPSATTRFSSVATSTYIASESNEPKPGHRSESLSNMTLGFCISAIFPAIIRRSFRQHQSQLIFSFVQIHFSVQFNFDFLPFELRVKRRQARNRFFGELEILQVKFKTGRG